MCYAIGVGSKGVGKGAIGSEDGSFTEEGSVVGGDEVGDRLPCLIGGSCAQDTGELRYCVCPLSSTTVWLAPSVKVGASLTGSR